MKWLGLVLIISLSCILSSIAQSKQSTELKPGQDVSQLIAQHQRYYYEQFQPGRVYFRNGVSSPARMNYNYLNQEIQFISAHGDTLSIARENALDEIKIGDETYVYNSSYKYLKIIEDLTSIKLAVKYFIKAIVNQSGQVLLLDRKGKSPDPLEAAGAEREVLTLEKGQEYFIIDKNQRIYPALRYNLFRIYPDNRAEIRNFIKQQRISFEEEKDLIRVVEYCNRLESELL